MSSFTWPAQGGSGGGVTSLNTLTGDIILAAGTGLSLSTLGQTITISSTTTYGNLTDAGTDGIVITGGTGAVVGSGTSIAQHVADTTHNGYLSSTDWNTFNNKSPTGNYATSGSGDVSWSAPSGAGPVTTSLVATSNSTLTTLSNLASIGTIGTGTWQATPIAATYGGTGISTASSTGYPSIASGTWSVASASGTFATLFETVATTAGDIIYGGTSGIPTRLAIGTAAQALFGGTSPTWTSSTSTPTASTFAGWDANVNFSANNLLDGYQSIVSSATPVTLTVTSPGITVFTGSTVQTLNLPVAATLANGTQFTIFNESSAAVTAKTSGGNTLVAISGGGNKYCTVTCMNNAGGTGTASWIFVYSNTNSLVNSITLGGTGTGNAPVQGGVIFGSSTSAYGSTAAGTTGQLLTSAGTGTPTWTSLKVPTVTRLIATGTQTGWLFTISTSTTCAVGDTYTNNGNTYTVQGALSAQTGAVLFMSGTGAVNSGAALVRTSGAGTSSITFSGATATATYTPPAGALYLEIEVAGGGGGGGGAGTGSPTNGSGGTTSYFGANIITCAGGSGGTASGGGPSAGGTSSVTSGPLVLAAVVGGGGSAGSTSGLFVAGGSGASGPFGGGGGSGNNNVAAGSATGYGAGGGGTGGATTFDSAAGGAAGGYAKVIIATIAASYPYMIGGGGAGGTGNGGSGGAGSGGTVFIAEKYQ